MQTEPKLPLTEAEEIKLALRDMISVDNRLALRIIVMEATIAEMLFEITPDRGKLFAKRFKSRIAELMQLHANRLLPFDDAEITLATNKVLGAITAG